MQRRDSETKEVTMVDPGAKHDTGKPAVHSVLRYFPRAITEVAKVSQHGASLHGWDTWDTIENPIERYSDAKVRHILASCMGEEVDSESNLIHAAHEAWNSLAILELMLRSDDVKD